jgi:hypothetical protein
MFFNFKKMNMLAAQLRMAEDAIAAEILNDALEHRPMNTKKCFTPPTSRICQMGRGKSLHAT